MNASRAGFPQLAAGTARENLAEEGWMKEPTTPDELSALHKILRSDPQRYLGIVNGWIDENPKNSNAYFSRHFAWMRIGEPKKAIDDLNKGMELERKPAPMSLLARGHIYRHLGEYEKALED